MKKVIQKINGAIQVILLAPVKLPSKLLNVIKYIGLGLGILESVVGEKDDQENSATESAGPRRAGLNAGNSVSDPERPAASEHRPDRLKKDHQQPGKEGGDETK